MRAFFAAREVLEVETPLLCGATVTDLHLASISAAVGGREHFLQTSPEYAMKRLLAAGLGAIFQLGKAFRDGESGRHHNPEFTLLEWYRPGFDHHALMAEVESFFREVVAAPEADWLSYREAFERVFAIDPHSAPVAVLDAVIAALPTSPPAFAEDDRDGRLDYLLTHGVEPSFASDRPTLLYDYPASQAALARLRPGDPPVAERFEVYWGRIELANGFHELTDAVEQRRRFAADLKRRRAAGLPPVALDERFLAALEAGMPAASGVALGFDRLAMIAAGADHLDEVLAFPLARA